MFLKLSKFPYVASLEIEQVKCFKEKQILKFTDENNRPHRWTVLLGDNGTGKTTILRSILMTKKGDYRFEKKQYLELLNIHENSVIKINYLNNEKIAPDFIAFKNWGKTIRVLPIDEFSIENYDEIHQISYFGYGAHRIGDKSTSIFFNDPFDTGNLIEEDSKLIDVERYFLDSDLFRKTKKTMKSDAEYEILKSVLLNILPEVEDLRVGTFGRTARLEFLTAYGWVKFSDMSMGYRTTIAWMVDLAVKMFLASPSSKNPLEQPAVVFVDEIDLHMHPQWQQKIIQHLTDKFPKTQFIVTAHSPLIVQSANEANVIVLKREGNQVVVENDPISVKNWRIDQILSSDLFGVTPRNLEVTQKMNRRKVLLLKDRLNTVERKELSQLQKEVGNLPTAESPEMIEAMELIIKTAKNLKK